MPNYVKPVRTRDAVTTIDESTGITTVTEFFKQDGPEYEVVTRYNRDGLVIDDTVATEADKDAALRKFGVEV